MIRFFRIMSLALVFVSAASQARVFPVAWTTPAQVDYIRIAATGDGVTSSLDTADLVFVLLKGQTVLNPANCAISDKYVFIPASANGKEDLMYSTLLAAAVAGLEVQLAVSIEFCDSLHPTIYDVKVAF